MTFYKFLFFFLLWRKLAFCFSWNCKEIVDCREKKSSVEYLFNWELNHQHQFLDCSNWISFARRQDHSFLLSSTAFQSLILMEGKSFWRQFTYLSLGVFILRTSIALVKKKKIVGRSYLNLKTCPFHFIRVIPFEIV